MQAIIPVAGIGGAPLQPQTYSQPKALIPVAGKPIVSFIVDHLMEAGCRDFVFVIGYMGEKIQAYVRSKYPEMNARFVVQTPRQGIGHAIWTARRHINSEAPLLICLGDTIVQANLSKLLRSKQTALGIKKVDDPRAFGVAEVNGKARIVKLEEKPKIPTSNKALVGLYYIRETQSLLNALEALMQTALADKEQYHLTYALQDMLEHDIAMKAFPVDNWYDCGKREVLLETNALLLKKKGYATDQKPRFTNSIIIHPVSLADNARIKNAIIGPNVSVGEYAHIDASIVRNSIIGNSALINSTILHDSVVGSEANVKGLSQSLNIGDGTEIDFS